MAATESSPLLPQYQRSSSSNTSPRADRPARTVTFNPLTTISTYGGASSPADPTVRPLQTGSPPVRNVPSSQPMLSTLNSKLRRRNSHGAPYNTLTPAAPASKIGPQRTTKNAQKLKLLPDPVREGEDQIDEDIPRDVYTQITRIKEPAARSHAARLGKADRERLPRDRKSVV